jgi:hypothetical protein
MPKFILLVSILFITTGVKAQTWEIGGGVGGAGYMGDLNQTNPLKVSGPSGSAFIKYNFNGYLAIKAAFSLGSISAADSTSSYAQQRERNLSFTTTLYEPSLLCEFNFFNYIPQIGKNTWTPYLYSGFAGLAYFPTTVYNGVKYDLRGWHTEGEPKPYPTTAWSIPYGAGVKYNFTGAFTIGAEIGYRNPNTNYLDDVSGYYVFSGHNTLQEQLSDRSGEKTGIYIGAPGVQRGDGGTGDTYFFTQVTISFTFISTKCYFHN